jgi:type II secretory pathway component PulK
MRYRHHQPGSSERRGIVLIAVIIIISLLTLAAYQYSELMAAEAKASAAVVKAARARAAAESGVNFAALLVSDPTLMAERLGGNPFDNPDVFSQVSIGPEGTNFFSVVSPAGPDDVTNNGQGFRYGVTDEAGKINLNSLLLLDSSGDLGVRILTRLGLSEELANAVMDWMDADDTPRTGGAEIETYGPLGYSARNAPLQSLEELLYVRGMTPQILLGNDLNRNGTLDPEEQQTGSQLDPGLQAYLTIYSREQNVSTDGSPRVYINTINTLQLNEDLTKAGFSPEVINYLIAYRINGPAPANASGSKKTAAQLSRTEVPLTLWSRSQRLASIYDLVNSQVLIKSRDPRQPSTLVDSPLTGNDQIKALLPLMLDKMATSKDQDLPARVNVNTAPRAVLLALSDQIAEADLDKIISARPAPGSQNTDPVFQSTAWLLTEAQLPIATLKSVERFLTARSQVYRMQVVGQTSQGGPTVRLEVVVDTNRGRPRLIYWRDLSELGRGFEFPPLQQQQQQP